MTQQFNLEDNQSADTVRRGRGPTKQFPVMKFEDVLIIPKTIFEEGLDNRLLRLSLFDRLDRRPNSGTSRNLITSSSRYGLTSGGYSAEYLTLTDDGISIIGQESSLIDIQEKIFECAIKRLDVFNYLYERLKNRRLPGDDVLQSELSQLGLNQEDCVTASEVFISNARYLKIIREVGGVEHIIPFEQLLSEFQVEGTSTLEHTTEDIIVDELPESSAVVPPAIPSSTDSAEPSLHIDIQIHIDSTATAEQIDQIFSSMARHLYGRKE